MNYRDPQLRDMLAGEYVLGTLSGRARRRFEQLLRDDVALRDAVSAWERRLTPLVDAVEPIVPPRRVWSAVQQRIAPGKRERLWQRAGFWRPVALLASVVALLLATQIYFLQPPTSATEYVAVLNDQQAQPAWVVSTVNATQVTIKAVRVPTQAERDYELWLLPGGDQPPRSLGLLPTAGSKTLNVPAELRTVIAAGKTLAVSVEPRGGSPTGLPTGPVLFQGTLVTTS